MSTSIRLVRCPRCRKILPELPNMPVYKCGGCGTTLRAKKQKNDINGNGSRAQTRHRYEPSIVLSSSSRDGDHRSIESSAGSETGREPFKSRKHISEKRVDKNSSDEHSHSTRPNYQQDMLSPEPNETAVQRERGRLQQYAENRRIESLDQKSRGRTSESRNHILEKHVDTDFSEEHSYSTRPNYQPNMLSPEPNESAVRGERGRLVEKYTEPRRIESLDQKSHDRTSDKIFESWDSFLTYEDLPEEIIISRKKDEERYSRKINVITSVNKIEDSHGVLAEEERCSGETQSLDDPEATRSSESELKLVVTKDQQNNGDGIGTYTNDIEDSSQEGKHSTGLQSSNNSATHSSVDEPLKLDDENEPSSEDEENSKVDTSPINPRVPMAPLLPDELYLEESPEIGPSFHRISSEEMLDTSPINPRVPIAPLSPDDMYLEESPEVGPNFHRRSSEEMLDTLPLNPRFPIAPFSPDDRYLEGSPEVGLSFHHVSSGEMLDTLPLNPRVPIAPFSPDDRYMEGSPEVGPNFHRVSSEEMLDSLPINPRAPVGSVSRSPTKTYYAGDESEYSYDGSAHISHPYSRKFKVTGNTGTDRSRQRIGFRVENKQSERDWRSHELLENRKHTYPIRTSMAAANNEPISRGAYMPRRSQLLHGNASPASSAQNVFMHNGQFRQPDTVVGSDPEKVELLRMVRELEDKINGTQMSRPISGERLPSRDVQEEIRSGRYYDDSPTGRNPYVDFKYSGHHRSHPKGVPFATPPRSPKPVFSGEASLCRNHIDCRCSHCYHQDMHISPRLSSHCIHCQHTAPPRHDYDNMYPSNSPSPQHFSSPLFSHEIPADNQKNHHELKKLNLREKLQVMKRHLRPVSGGAPIINCYICSQLLQLPADFLLFKKRCHQLRCSSCNTILKFSILKKSRLVPYVIKIQGSLPSEMDNYNNIIGSTTLAPTSHINNPQDAGPISISDDNGSTESGPSVPSSSRIINDKKTLTVMEVYGMSKSPRDNIEAAGPSSSTATWVRPSSEIQELPATPSSPLHRLMGYESARHVLFANSKDESDDGLEFYKDRQIR